MRPSPCRSQANKPAVGTRGSTRSKPCSSSQLRRTPGEVHIEVFMAAAASTGASVAKRVLANRLSANPCTHRPRVVALKGATNTKSAHSASSTCSGLAAR
jgi:hypothetical protein